MIVEQCLHLIDSAEKQLYYVKLCDLENALVQNHVHFDALGKKWYDLYTGPVSSSFPHTSETGLTFRGFAHFLCSNIRNPDINTGLLDPLLKWIEDQSTECQREAEQAIEVFAIKYAKRTWKNETGKEAN